MNVQLVTNDLYTQAETIRAASPLAVRGLTVSYGQTPAIFSVDLTVRPGAMTAIVGPNGAGKSTLLKAALQVIKPLAGTVTVFGQPLVAMRDRIAYVPQRASVDWDFPTRVIDVVLMGMYRQLGLLGRVRSKHRTTAMHALERVGMTDFATRQIGQLSGGQHQRVAVLRATALATLTRAPPPSPSWGSRRSAGTRPSRASSRSAGRRGSPRSDRRSSRSTRTRRRGTRPRSQRPDRPLAGCSFTGRSSGRRASSGRGGVLSQIRMRARGGLRAPQVRGSTGRMMVPSAVAKLHPWKHGGRMSAVTNAKLARPEDHGTPDLSGGSHSRARCAHPHARVSKTRPLC